MEYTKISKKMKSPVDGLELDLLILVPEEAPKGILQIHHGMAEYKERYLPFMKYFAEAGYVVAIHDCRGHGKSVRTKKDLGYMYGAGMDALIEDTAEVTRMLKEEWQGVPLILLGHSMGSMVVRCFTKKYDDLLNMLVVCGSPSKNPGAKIGIALAAVQEKISGAHHVSRFLELLSLGSYSGKFAGEGSRFAWCCSDEQVVRAYEASELCGFIFTVDADQVLFQLMDETYRPEIYALNQNCVENAKTNVGVDIPWDDEADAYMLVYLTEIDSVAAANYTISSSVSDMTEGRPSKLV